MSIEHVLAVVPVSDLERADTWYETLFGRPADSRPMPGLVVREVRVRRVRDRVEASTS